MAPAKQTQRNNVKVKKSRKSKGGMAKKLLIGGMVTAFLGVIIALVAYLMITLRGSKLLEEYQGANKMEMSEASVVYDADNKEVTTLYRENREIVEYKDIPKQLANAFIATEDRRFSEHSGVDFVAIGRALVTDIMHRSMVEGGSTITQQLAKNLFLSSDKTAFRKATEVSIALALEHQMSKEQILEMYLNQIYFGKGAYGVKAASKRYFGISDLSQLKIWQMATLAAIPKSPSTYSPLLNPEKSKERRAVVLKLMYDQGYITAEEKAEAEAVDYTPPPQVNNKEFATFTDYIVREAQEMYGIEEEKLLRGGYSIYTTMSQDAQRVMEQTYDNPKFFQKDASDGVKIQSAMAIVNNKDGGIVAMIGGRDYQNKGTNRAVSATRQPGSSFKPIVVYGPAIETGKYSPYSKLIDERRTYNGYTPLNYSDTYAGQVDMFEAVAKSLNAPAVWLLNEIGVNTGMKFATKLGFTFDKRDNNLAIALGGITNGTSPLQMAQAYAAFANGGYLNKSHAINRIVDAKGVEVANFKVEKGSPVMSAKTAWYVTQLLQGVVTNGTGKAANIGTRPTAGKTGTTELDIDLNGAERKYNRDAWFAGYTPEWSAAVWEGFDRTDAKHYVTDSSSGTAAIFKEVVGKALAKAPVVPFQKPAGVPDPSEPPKTAVDLKAEYDQTAKKIKLNWTAADDQRLTYQIFRKSGKEEEFKKLLEIKNGAEASDISIVQGETYQYYVQTYDPDSTLTGEPSNTVSVKAGEAVASPTPGTSGSPTPTPSGKGSPLPGVSNIPGVSTLPGGGTVSSPGTSATPVPSGGSPAASPSGATPKPSPTPSGSPATSSVKPTGVQTVKPAQ